MYFHNLAPWRAATSLRATAETRAPLLFSSLQIPGTIYWLIICLSDATNLHLSGRDLCRTPTRRGSDRMPALNSSGLRLDAAFKASVAPAHSKGLNAALNVACSIRSLSLAVLYWFATALPSDVRKACGLPVTSKNEFGATPQLRAQPQSLRSRTEGQSPSAHQLIGSVIVGIAQIQHSRPVNSQVRKVGLPPLFVP